MDDILKEFLVESYENLDRMDRDFVELEKKPSQETLASIFRAIHTIKGTSGFLGLGQLESVTHAGESLLSLLRDGKLTVTPAITDALLSLVDAVREMLATTETTGNEGLRDDSALIETLSRLQTDDPAPPAKESQPAIEGNQGANADPVLDLTNASLEDIDRLLEERAKASAAVPVPASTPASIPKVKATESVRAAAESKTTVSDSTVRVDVGLLDKLMNLVGELVLARNQIMQFATAQEDPAFLATSQHLNLVTGELQEGVMKTRMQPIGNVWNKFPRIVRDLAASRKKQVRIEMVGADTELDRTIVEAIKDPLTHVVRNSVDHGIESPETRAVAGKPAEGRLLLRAYHEGGQVNIEIADDGGGIHGERVRDKAISKGLITADQAARMSERELVNLIFLPGFSTAEIVTNVSGRGVGMDVVKTNIEKIGGMVDVQSVFGQGTILKMKIPLTLAIVPALIVGSGGARYAIPQVSLLELVRLDGEPARNCVERMHGAPVYRLRGNLLPLVYLNQLLRLPESAATDESVNIVVLQADGHQFGLVVDGIHDSKDIVVKPLGKHLKGITAFSGATILGDGKVALILDVVGISQCANFASSGNDRNATDTATHAATDEALQELLIINVGADGRAAVPLELVARLEEFDPAVVESSDGREVVQYRGEIMPLIRVTKDNAEKRLDKTLQGIVFRDRSRTLGVVVDQIVDIVKERVRVSSETGANRLIGTAVVHGKVTDLLNLRWLAKSANQELAGELAA